MSDKEQALLSDQGGSHPGGATGTGEGVSVTERSSGLAAQPSGERAMLGAYGLAVASEIDLPELHPLPGAERHRPADLEVRRGALDETLPGGTRSDSYTQVTDRTCLYDFPAIGRFLVEDGGRIVVDQAPRARDSDMRAYLFGSVFGTLLHQRGLVPLHLSAVRTPRGVWAFTGHSGAGKSTMASMLHRLTGWPILCDDVAVLRPGDPAPILYAGISRLKLWDDAAARLGRSTDEMVRDVTRAGKFHLFAPDMFDDGPAPLSTLLHLERGAEVEVSARTGFDRFTGVMEAIYRPYFVGVFGDQVAVTRTCARVADRVEVMTLRRPWTEDGLSRSVEHIVDILATGTA